MEQHMLERVLPSSAKDFGRAIVMPNIDDDMISTAKHATNYQKALAYFMHAGQMRDFHPLLTIKVTPKTTPADILAAKEAGVFAAKFYPQGVTTNSAGGISNFTALADAYACLQEIGMPALFHAEMPDSFMLKAEDDFKDTIYWIATHYSKLKMVVEHVSSRCMLKLILETLPNVGLSLTAHHLTLTYEDVFGNPWNYCKPIAKTETDRQELIAAAISGNPRVWFGSDSAPHPPEKKTGSKPAAGIWSAPVAMPLLAQIFEDAGALDRLEDFTSKAGAAWYGLTPNQGKITLEKKDWVVPGQINGIVPFMAGKTLSWQVV